MATLSEGIFVVKDWGLTVVLPALLVFALLYAILTKYELLGEKEWANVLISAIVSLVFVTLIKAVKFTSNFLSVFAAGLVVLFTFILLLKLVLTIMGMFK